MSVKLVRFIFGYTKYRIPCEYSDKAADILMRSGANFRDMRLYDGELVFKLELRDCAAVERIFSRCGIMFESLGEYGLPRLVKKYRKRIGIPIGMIIFALILFMSERVIWSLEVVGNDKIPSEVILGRLGELGCGLGTYIPGTDFDSIGEEYLLTYGDTAWLSVNVRGTHASVEVRETELPEITADDKTPHNLVAAYDGTVYSVEIHRGIPVVEVGDYVRKGELLASGIVDIKSGYILAHASGEVKGTVTRDINIEVPLEGVRSVPTGREFRDKYLEFFGFSFGYLKGSDKLSADNDSVKYGKRSERHKLTVFDCIELPIEVDESVYIEYGEYPVTYTEDEARSLAYDRLSEALREVSAVGEIISKETESALENGVYRIRCRLTMICDITEEIPIYINSSNNSQEK